MKHLIVCFAALLLLGSCTKEDLESILPPETTTGANTAGFIVDGKTVVLPSNSVSSVPGSGTSYGLYAQFGPEFSNTGNDYFSLEIANAGSEKTYAIYLRMPNMKNGEGKYLLGQSNGDTYYDGPNYPQVILIMSGNNTETRWYYSSENSGFIELTRVDNDNYYYAGKFECTLYNREDSTQTLKISKGRFDINARTLNK